MGLLTSGSFAGSVKGFVETASSPDNGYDRSHLYGRGIAAAATWPEQLAPPEGLGAVTVRMAQAAHSDGLPCTTTPNAPRAQAG